MLSVYAARFLVSGDDEADFGGVLMMSFILRVAFWCCLGYHGRVE